MKTINILIVDDHPVLREGIEVMLSAMSNHSLRFEGAQNGIEGLEYLKSNRPHLIITDVRMPRMDGISFTKTIRKTDKTIPILMMTVLSSIDTITKAVEFGVNGYITKLTSASELNLAVETLLRGENYFSTEVSQMILKNRNTNVTADLRDILTDREIQVLRLISKDYTQAEMAKELSISSRTIEGHARNLRSKLKAKSAAGMVMNAIKQGLIE